MSDDDGWREEVGPVPHAVHKHGTLEYEAYRAEWYRRIEARAARLGLPKLNLGGVEQHGSSSGP